MFDLGTIQRMNNAVAKARLKFAKEKSKRLVLPNGLRYGESSEGKRVCLGVRMGRPDRLPLPASQESVKLRLQRLPFVDGCYDRWRAYWGAPANVWCAWAGDDIQVFVRADSRDEAKRKVLKTLPKAKFYR